MGQQARTWDLIVVGGGLTGIGAAVAGARQGLSVLLVEKAGALGGAPVNCLVNPFMRYWTQMEENGVSSRFDLSRGIFTEINQMLEALGGIEGTVFHEEYLKIAWIASPAKKGWRCSSMPCWQGWKSRASIFRPCSWPPRPG